MIRDLLTPEAQRDPYIWSAVLWGHMALGMVGGAFVSWWAVLIYIVFEIVQAITARGMLLWDSILDACAFACGVLIALSLWTHDLTLTGAAVLICAAITTVGVWARTR